MKKSKLIMTCGLASLLIAGSAFALTNNAGMIARGDVAPLSVKWDINSRTSANNFAAKTTSGSTLTCYGVNTMDGGTNYDFMLYFKNNGSGFYFDNEFQSIVSVTITYKFASTGTLDLHLVPTESDFYTENDEKINMVPDIATGYNTMVTRTFNASNPENTHFLRIWSTNAARIYDITVNYYCAAL